MTRVFISYRRADSQAWADRIYPVLVRAFGKGNVFKDIDSIGAGQNFRTAIEKAVISADVVIILIGRQWVTITDSQGRKRLENPDDAVRLEVEMALRHVDIVIPVVVDGAQIPSPIDIPPTFNNLPFLNGANVRGDPDFDHDMDRLIRAIRERLGGGSSLSKGVSNLSLRTLFAVGAIILILVVLSLAVLNRQSPPISNTPTFTQQVAQVPTTSLTTINTAVPTLSSTEIESTIQGEMDVAQTDVANTQSAEIALKTANAFATDAHSAADQTATADQWTLTPTIDSRGTALARIVETQNAATNVTNISAPTDSNIDNGPTLTLAPTASNAAVQITGVAGVGNIAFEAVTIRNNGDVVNLNHWTLETSKGNIYTFTERILFSNGLITIYNRVGQETVVASFWNQTKAIFQVGDVIILKDAKGNVQSSYRIPPYRDG